MLPTPKGQGVSTFDPAGFTLPGTTPFVALSSRDVRRSTFNIKGAINNIGGEAEFMTTGLASGFVNIESQSRSNARNGYSGYLKGARPSTALDYVLSYFLPDDDPDLPSARPLTAESYQDFNDTMYRQFILGNLAGEVSYPQPSVEDIRTILMSHPKVLARSIRFPVVHGQTVQGSDVFFPGLPGSEFKPTPGGPRVAGRSAASPGVKVKSGSS